MIPFAVNILKSKTISEAREYVKSATYGIARAALLIAVQILLRYLWWNDVT